MARRIFIEWVVFKAKDEFDKMFNDSSRIWFEFVYVINLKIIFWQNVADIFIILFYEILNNISLGSMRPE